MPNFSEFYEAVNGQPPFPWQRRLANRVAETGSWPDEIGVPTGLGKTACLDIAIWWLASQADRPPADRTAPTRVWWLVNRRLLVDSTAEHAQFIADALQDPEAVELGERPALVMHAVADRLRSLAASHATAPLEVIRLRGGVHARRPTDPSRPAVMLSTIPMYGSRLLFRGYGTSRSMRPVDAALAGADTLLLVDEAHLARPLVRLMPDLAACTPGSSQSLLNGNRSSPQVVSLTATGDLSGDNRFDLDAEDEAHPVVQQRLDAPKHIEVQEVPRDIDKALAQAAESLLAEAGRATSCLVFSNSPRTARATFNRLRRSLSQDQADILLLTGRTREREAERTRAHILDREQGMAASRDPTAVRGRHLVVVATQTLEVGADVDAECLVTETCGVRALTQRLGRLNRLGRFPNARAVYVHAPPKKKVGRSRKTDEWPVYGNEPEVVVGRLQKMTKEPAGGLSVSPRHVSKTLGRPGDDPGRSPEVLSGLLWEWVKTTTPPEGEAPVEPYFAGIAGAEYSVSLLWRAHVPNAGERLWPRANDRETIAVPIGEARQTLEADVNVTRLGPDGITAETIAVDDLRPGDAVILRSDRGLLDEFGWNPESSDAVVDMSIPRQGLPLDAEAIRTMCGLSVTETINMALGIADDDEDVTETDQGKAVDELLNALADHPASGWEAAEWRDMVAALRPTVVRGHLEVPRLELKAGTKPGRGSDELDEMSMADTAVQLELHGQAVAATARSIAECLGLPREVTELVEMAGRLHDFGKADRRFQLWLDPSGRANGPVAKSGVPRNLWAATREAAGWPRGGRHEALSARLVSSWLTAEPNGPEPLLADLLVHLVISHHGNGRPIVRPVRDAISETVTGSIQGRCVKVAASLSEVDWIQPARFRRLHDHWGPWGLALLEAIVRQADHLVSSGTTVDGMNRCRPQ